VVRSFLSVAAICALGACSRRASSLEDAISAGDQAFRSRKFDEAGRFYRQAVNRDATNGPAYQRLGAAEANAGHPIAAIAALRRAVQLLPKTDPRHRAARLDLAELSLAHQRNSETLDDSEATAQEMLQTNPNDAEGWRIYGTVALARAEWLRTRDRELYGKVMADALRSFESADKARPGDLRVLLALARAHAADEKFAEAEQRYRTLLAKYERADAARAEWYRLLQIQGRTAEARDVLRGGARSGERPEWFLQMWAAQELVQRDYAAMQQALDELAPRARSRPAVCLFEGDFYLRAGDAERALEEYQRCTSLDDATARLRDQRLIAVLGATGRSAEAASIVQSMLNRDPRDPVARMHVARASISSGETDNALRELESVSAEDPRNYEARFEKARAHLKRGEVEQARLSAVEALGLRPDFLPALLLNAQIQFSRQEYAGAALTVKEIFAADRDSPEGRLMETVLRGVKSAAEGKASDSRLADAAAQIASGKYEKAEGLLQGDAANGPQASREMVAAPPAAGDPRTVRFAYLKNSECDDAVTRYRRIATRPDDPFALTRAVDGPWPAPEKTTRAITFAP
jgi:tetratricopeptide (TPR) repeat protein